MLRYVNTNILFLVSFSSAGQAASPYINFLEREEPEVSKVQSKFLDKTKDALLSYDYIEERADYVLFKLKNLTFREYSDDILYLAPFVTGNLQLRVENFDIYYDYNSEKSGIKYKVNF